MALKERLRPIVSETLAKLHSSSVPLEERIQVLKKMLSVELPLHVSSHILDENFDSHARQLFLHQHPFENGSTSNDMFKVVSTPDATIVNSNSLEVSNDNMEVDFQVDGSTSSASRKINFAAKLREDIVRKYISC